MADEDKGIHEARGIPTVKKEVKPPTFIFYYIYLKICITIDENTQSANKFA